MSWIQRLPIRSPAARAWPAFAYDPATERSILFTGWTSSTSNLLSDVWHYAATQQASVRTFGMGCPGSFGNALLSSPTRPWLGDKFDAVVTGLGSRPSAWMAVGFSSSTWGARPLPLDLGPLGLAGCKLYVSIDVLVVGIPVVNGSAVLTIPIPNLAAIAGQPLFLQSFVPDTLIPLANSNALEARIGAR